MRNWANVEPECGTVWHLIKEAALQAEEIDFEDSQPLSFSEIKKKLNLTSSTFGKDSGIEMIKVNYCTKSNQLSQMIPSFRHQILLSTRELTD